MLPGFPFLQDFLAKVTLPKESRRGGLDGREPVLFFWGHVPPQERVSFHTFLLESTDLLSPIVSNLYCFFIICP